MKNAKIKGKILGGEQMKEEYMSSCLSRENILTVVAMLYLVTIILTGCVGMGGEVISLNHDPLIEPTNRFTETINAKKVAEDHRFDQSTVGKATVTVFAIESGSVITWIPVREEVIRQIKEALESIGYQVTLVDESQLQSMRTPVMRVGINKFRFKNYNWFWPIVPTWGDIAVWLALENPEGKIVWSKSFNGSGRSFCLVGKCAFETAIRRSMTSVLNGVVQACSSEEFHNALLMQ